jgi:hypothetical protein
MEVNGQLHALVTLTLKQAAVHRFRLAAEEREKALVPARNLAEF